MSDINLEDLPLAKKVDLILKNQEEIKQKELSKEKKFRLPMKAKVNKTKLKKSYATVQVIDENKNVHFTRKQIVDGTIRLDDTYHAVDDLDILIYKGKPLIIQPKHRANPWNPINATKETYGHKYIMAKMKSDVIKATGKKFNPMVILIVIAVIIAVYYFFSQGGIS